RTGNAGASAASFDHLVGALLENPRHVEAQYFGGLEVDHQLELYRRLHGKLARLLALEDAVDIRRRPSEIIRRVVSVGKEAAEFGEEAVGVDGGETVASGQRYYLRAMDVQEGLWHHDQAAIRLMCLCGDGGCELGHIANGPLDCLHSKRPSGGFEGIQEIFGKRRGCRVEQEGRPSDARSNFLKQLQPLAGDCRFQGGETGDVAARSRQACDEAATDRIGDVPENDRDGSRSL